MCSKDNRQSKNQKTDGCNLNDECFQNWQMLCDEL